MDERLPLSVSLISYNEEENLARTLGSIVGIASEIIVVDSHSTDKTREIATAYGSNVYVENWKGFIEQKNSALEKCTQERVLCLDCDEVVSEGLKYSIIDAVMKNKYSGYSINRRTFYLGKLLKYSWQPDYNLRLVKKKANPVWGGYEPHASLDIREETSKLKGDLIHYTYSSFDDHIKKLINYAETVSESYYKKGKKFRLYNLIFNPFFTFIKKYILKLGVLDGSRGFITSLSSFIYVFLKYSFLWERERLEDEKRTIKKDL